MNDRLKKIINNNWVVSIVTSVLTASGSPIIKSIHIDIGIFNIHLSSWLFVTGIIIFVIGLLLFIVTGGKIRKLPIRSVAEIIAPELLPPDKITYPRKFERINLFPIFMNRLSFIFFVMGTVLIILNFIIN